VGGGLPDPPVDEGVRHPPPTPPLLSGHLPIQAHPCPPPWPAPPMPTRATTEVKASLRWWYALATAPGHRRGIIRSIGGAFLERV